MLDWSPNQALQPTQHFVPISETMRTLVFKVLGADLVLVGRYFSHE
jgi:hypothetical protein